MQFTTAAFTLAASAAVANAASVTFWALDNVQRTVYFTANAGQGYADIAPVTVAGGSQQTVSFPDVWIGNFYAVQQGQAAGPGMLGEVNFGGWNGQTYFDVSAIVNPNDQNNVKQMWPKGGNSPMSGCETFPCNNAYYLPDDVQTKVTPSADIMCSLGSGSTGIAF